MEGENFPQNCIKGGEFVCVKTTSAKMSVVVTVNVQKDKKKIR